MKEPPLTFLVDHMLGKLAKYLRILGLDTIYFTQNDLSALIENARQEKRIILSRNSRFKPTDGFPDFILINDDQPDKQVCQVAKFLQIHLSPDQFFSRCLTCNQKLIGVALDDVKGKVPTYIFETHKNFSFCPQCKKIYWAGTHLKKMNEMIRKVAGENNSDNDAIEA